MKKLLSMVFVFLLISSSLSVAQITPLTPRMNELGENVFGEQETGESIIVEAYEYEPKQVPSGVLEEQPVPVYVFLKATTLGGLIAGENSPENAPFYGLPEVKLVSNPVVVGGDRRFVGGITFVPSNRGRRTLVDDTGRFIDLGYFIVRLNKIDKESELPGFKQGSFDVEVADVDNVAKTSFLQTGGGRIDLNVSLDIRFGFENSLGGFGAADLLLGEEANEAEWKKDVTIADSFWNGKGYVRANRIDEKSVQVVVYDSNLRQIRSVTLNEGQESSPIALYLYPFTLVDRFRIQLQKIDVAADKVRFLVGEQVVLRGKGERIVAGSDWIVDKIVKARQLDDGSSIEQVDLRNTKTGKLEHFQRRYLGTRVETTYQEFLPGAGKPVPTKTTTIPPFVGPPTPTTSTYERLVQQYADKYKVDANLIKAVVQQESSWNFKAVSECGAAGLMQLMPGTAYDYGIKPRFEDSKIIGCTEGRPYASRLRQIMQGKSDAELIALDARFDADKNIQAGVLYLYRVLNRYSMDEELALAAYNAGPGNVDEACPERVFARCDFNRLVREGKFTSQKVTEIKNYVPRILTYKKDYATGGRVVPPTAVAASGTIGSPEITGSPKIEPMEIERDCSNFKDFAHEKLDENKGVQELYCKAIKELEKTLTLTDDGNVRGEAYYWIGENYLALGNYQLALNAYEQVTGLYQIRAQSKMVDASEKLKGKVVEETKAYLEEEGLQVGFLGVRELKSQEGPAAYIRVNKGDAKKFGLDSVLPTGSLNDGKAYQLKIDAIDRAQVVLRKVYEDKSPGGQIVIREGGQRVINEGVQVTLDVVDIESKDEALITILPGSGRAVSRSYVQLHIPVEQRAIQFSGKQIDWQINKTQALIQKMDTTIAKMNTWLQRWKLACFGVYGFLTMKNFLRGGDDVKAREIVYRGLDNGKGVDDLICNEGNIGYNKQYQSADECRLKNRKVLEGFVDATKDKLGEIENFNKQLNAMTENGKKPLKELTPEQQEMIWKEIAGGEQVLSYENQFKVLVRNDGLSNQEILQAYKSKVLSAAYDGKKNELIQTAKVPEVQVNAVLKQYGDAYGAQLGKLRDAATDYALVEKKIQNNQNVPKEVIQLMVTDEKEKKKIKDSGEDYRVYKTFVEGQERYYAYEGGNPIELEQKKDDKNLIVKDEFFLKGKDLSLSENSRKASGGVFRFGEILTAFKDRTIQVDQNGRVVRMPWKQGQYIRVLEWYQNGDPKTLQVVGYRDVVGASEEIIIYHQSAVDADLPLKRELETHLKRKPFCKPPETYSVEGVVFTCNQQLPREEHRGVQCQEVMPAADCAVLFNVCDPVICPASRFDLGGRWKLPPGRSVVDTGVFGALTLGMPNFVGFGGENVIPPICGPGVLAGLESWRSMLQAYNQCMIASKTSGKNVGICDAIRSVYVCEIVWREAKSFGGFIGGLAVPAKVRGGGEYTDFQKSLMAIGDSAKFFTQEYGRSSFAAFKSRSLDEAGTEFCKAAYFGKAPGLGELLNKLAQPESPPQFTAWFDSFEWTGEAGRTALNPGISLTPPAEQNRYAIYYHIYAGHDREVRYSVWLQDRSGSVRVPVTNALGGVTREVIAKGGYADKQVEIIAGKGLEQMCVEINGAVYCGFGKVATGFLQNYVNDVLVKNELGKEITNEKDCVGDANEGPNIKGVALPTQAGFGSSAVRRICSLKDPDEGSNQERWKVVGSCGKGENAAGQVVDYGSCWIDTASLNLQFRNLDDAAKKRLGELGNLYPDAFAAEEKLKREKFQPLFDKLERLFADIVKVNSGIQLRKKQEVIGKYSAAMDGVSSLIATSAADEDYQFLVENSVYHAGNSSLRIGQLYMALADLKDAVEVREGKSLSSQESLGKEGMQGEQQTLFDENQNYIYLLKTKHLLFGDVHLAPPVVFKLRGNRWIWSTDKRGWMETNTKTVLSSSKIYASKNLPQSYAVFVDLLDGRSVEEIQKRILRIENEPVYEQFSYVPNTLENLYGRLTGQIGIFYKYENKEWLWSYDQKIWNKPAVNKAPGTDKTLSKAQSEANIFLDGTKLIPESIWDTECEAFPYEEGNYTCAFFVGERATIDGLQLKFISLGKRGAAGEWKLLDPKFEFYREGKLLDCRKGFIDDDESLLWQVRYRDDERGGRVFDPATRTARCEDLGLSMSVLGYNAEKNQLQVKVSYPGPFSFRVQPEVFDVERDTLLKANVHFNEVSFLDAYINYGQESSFGGASLVFTLHDNVGKEVHAFDPVKIESRAAREVSYNLDLRKAGRLEEGVYFVKGILRAGNEEVASDTEKIVGVGGTTAAPPSTVPTSPDSEEALSEEFALSVFEEALCNEDEEFALDLVGVTEESGGLAPAAVVDSQRSCLVALAENYQLLVERITAAMQKKNIAVTDKNFQAIVQAGTKKHEGWDFNTLSQRFTLYLKRFFSFSESKPASSQKVSGVVILDVGHGGRDPGALSIPSAEGKKLVEKNIVLDVALRMKDSLIAQGLDVKMTRESDAYLGIDRRQIIGESYAAQSEKPAVFVSLHADTIGKVSRSGTCSVPQPGLHAYVFCTCRSGSLNNKKLDLCSVGGCKPDPHSGAYRLANAIQSRVNPRLQVGGGDFSVLYKNKVPGILVEMGFLCDERDLASLDDEASRAALAEKIAAGVVDYFQQA